MKNFIEQLDYLAKNQNVSEKTQLEVQESLLEHISQLDFENMTCGDLKILTAQINLLEKDKKITYDLSNGQLEVNIRYTTNPNNVGSDIYDFTALNTRHLFLHIHADKTNNIEEIRTHNCKLNTVRKNLSKDIPEAYDSAVDRIIKSIADTASKEIPQGKFETRDSSALYQINGITYSINNLLHYAMVSKNPGQYTVITIAEEERKYSKSILLTYHSIMKDFYSKKVNK